MHLLASCALATLIGAASIISTASAQLLDRKDLSFATALTVATGALEACISVQCFNFSTDKPTSDL
jgi:hypothetical protein